MRFAAFILVSSIYCLFNLLILSPLIWFIICMVLSVTAYSVLTINLNTTGALWVTQQKPQNTISAVREGFGLVGLVTAVSLPNFLEKVILPDEVYKWFSFVLLLLTIIGFAQFSIWYRSSLKKVHQKTTPSFVYNFKSFSLDSKIFFGIYLISMFASSIPAVLVIFFVRDLLDAAIYTGFFLLLYFVSAICFMPFWNFMSQKHGKYKSWFFSMLLASFSFIWAFLLTKGDLWQYGFICLVSGSALGADLVFPPSIVADHIHSSKAQNNASTYYGVLTLLSKASLAVASGLSFFILDYAEFTPGGENSEISLMGLSVAYAFIPCIIKIGAAFLLWNLLIKSPKGNFHENH